MMQEDNKNFDFIVKSMMSDAEEEVPSRVWDAVSAHLDAQKTAPVAAGRRGGWAVLSWPKVVAVASVAAAVAVTAILSYRQLAPVSIDMDSASAVNIGPAVENPGASTDKVPGTEASDAAMVAGSHVAPDAGTVAVSRSAASEAPSSGSPSAAGVVSAEDVSSGFTDGSGFHREESAGQKQVSGFEPDSSKPEQENPAAKVEDLQKEDNNSGRIAAGNIVGSPAETTVQQKDNETEQEEIPADKAEPDMTEEAPAEGIDPFNQMAWEDFQAERKHTSVSLTFGGDVQSNGNPAASHEYNTRKIAGTKAPTHSTIEQVSKESSYSVPISFGLGARIGLGGRFSIATGLTFSMLERTFTGTYTKVTNGSIEGKINSDIHSNLHYIGIPVGLYYDIIRNDRIKLYAFGSGTVEKALYNNFRIENKPKAFYHKESVKGLQWSASAGIGVAFSIARHIHIYMDPSLRYFFDCKQPLSIRTQQPLSLDFEAGLRFDI